MPQPLTLRIVNQVREARSLYHRLVLVVGETRSGKTTALRALQRDHAWPLLNVNLILSERLLPLTIRQRAVSAQSVAADVLAELEGDVILLDNIEMLFHPELHLDPLRLLQSQSRNRILVVAWRGNFFADILTYAAPDHPEFRRYPKPGALVVPAAADGGVTISPNQTVEHLS